MPGLTRDAVSTELSFRGRRIRVVDTPGIPKADGVLPPSLNSLSIYHAHKQLSYAHVVALILDGSRLLTKHDLALAKEVIDKGRGLFIVLNKSDVMQSTAVAKKQLVSYIDRYVPMVGVAGTCELGGKGAVDRHLRALRDGNRRLLPAGAGCVRPLEDAHLDGHSEPLAQRDHLPAPAAAHQLGKGGQVEVGEQWVV